MSPVGVRRLGAARGAGSPAPRAESSRPLSAHAYFFYPERSDVRGPCRGLIRHPRTRMTHVHGIWKLHATLIFDFHMCVDGTRDTRTDGPPRPRTDSKHQARRSGREGYRAASLPCALHIETVTLPRCIQIVDPDPAAFTTPLYKADPQYQRPLHPPPRRRSAFAALAKRVSAFAAPTLAPWALPCVSRRRDLPGRT